ncbi:MAG: T9SS type A sorting domain-containing protein [Ignavibacteriae bacterium]|nr:T9SS type A sorting domain-containing protein [Ignavibacteriota bacterium]
MNNIAIVFLLSAFSLSPALVHSQGWENITPTGVTPIHASKGINFQNGGYSFYVWSYSAHKGFRLTPTMQWDSVLTYYSYICDPIYLDYITYQLVGLEQSSVDPNMVFSIFIRTGCIVECYTHLYSDTTGQVSFQNHVKWFDDFLCVGVQAKTAVSPINPNEVYLVFFDSLYYSSDSGKTFGGISSPYPNNYSPVLSSLALSPYDSNVVFTSGFEQYQQSGFLYRSTDKGQTWTTVLDKVVTQMEFHPTSPLLMHAVSDSGIFRSSDGGITWVQAREGRFLSLESDANDPSTLYAGRSDGSLWSSTDEGISWTIYNNTFSNLPLHGIHSIPGSDTLIVAAVNGVFKVFASFVVSVNGREAMPTQFRLEQNYPNPFNPRTSFKFTVPSSKWVTLKVYDLLGREVETLVNEAKEPGTYEVVWDAVNMSSGVYFCRMTAGSFSETTKLIFLR